MKKTLLTGIGMVMFGAAIAQGTGPSTFGGGSQGGNDGGEHGVGNGRFGAGSQNGSDCLSEGNVGNGRSGGGQNRTGGHDVGHGRRGQESNGRQLIERETHGNVVINDGVEWDCRRATFGQETQNG